MTATPTTSISFQNFFSATLTADITSSSTDIFLDTVPNGSEGFLVIEPDSTSAREVIYYNSKTATKVVCPSAADGRGQDDTTAGAHLTGATVIMAPVAAYFETLLSLFTTSPQGWTSLSGTFTSPVNNGQRSITVNTSVDQRSVLSKGSRLKLTRSVAAPTQCTSLNGTTQYYSKTSPAGMTFTNNFVATGWVKLSSYGAISQMESRYNGTSGWQFRLEASGQVTLVGFNGGAANFKILTSYQSVPINKWVHIAAQLDMTSATNSPTVNYVMIDGVDVPALQSSGGTAPTALIQAGNYEIGSTNGGTQPFPGKIAQVAVFNAKVTQATIRTYSGQTLSGSESSLISAYSFNNTINDLNVSNANNLTTNGAAVATSSDSPFAGGADIPSGVTAGTTEYGILTDISSSTITFQHPEGYAIPTSGGISAASYSTYKVPYGFPGQQNKWRVGFFATTGQSQTSPVSGTWYNPGSFQLNIPVGEWEGSYETPLYVSRSVAGDAQAVCSLSTSASSNTNIDMSGDLFFTAVQGALAIISRKSTISVAAATPYYLICKANIASMTGVQLGDTPTTGTVSIYADLSYL